MLFTIIVLIFLLPRLKSIDNQFSNENIKKNLIKTLLTTLHLIFFTLYYLIVTKLIEQNTEINLFSFFIILLIYQYAATYFLAYIFSFAIPKLTRKSYEWCYVEYIHQQLKNSIYLILFIIYFILKVILTEILKVGEININYTEFVEAIAMLYLIDTYVEKLKLTKIEHQNYISNHNIMTNTERIMNTQFSANSNNNSTETESSIDESVNSNINTTESINNINPSINEGIQTEQTAIPELLDILRSEYEIERDKKQSFETRTGLLITLLGVTFIFCFDKISFNDLINLFDQDLNFYLLIEICCGVFFFISSALAIYNIVKTLKTDSHYNYNLEMTTTQYLSEARLDALLRNIEHYREIVEQHRDRNEMRAKYYTHALYSTFGILISFAIYLQFN